MKLIVKFMVLFCIIFSFGLKAQENQGSSAGAVENSVNSTDPTVMMAPMIVQRPLDQVRCFALSQDRTVSKDKVLDSLLDGLYITSVNAHSPAAKAGIEPGMQLVSVNIAGKEFSFAGRGWTVRNAEINFEKASKVEVTQEEKLKGSVVMIFKIYDHRKGTKTPGLRTIPVKVNLITDTGSIAALTQ